MAKMLRKMEAQKRTAGNQTVGVRRRHPIGTWKAPYGSAGGYREAAQRGTAVAGTGVPAGE